MGSSLFAQQIIGFFPQMDGGFEGQSLGSLPSTSSSSSPSVGQWARGGISGSGNATILSSGARTGAQYISVLNSKTSDNISPRTYLTPAIFSAPILPATSYVIQFYCKATNNLNFPNTTLQAGLSSAKGTPASYATFVPAGSPNVYTKVNVVVVSPTILSDTGFSAVKVSSNTTNLSYALDIDDWVVYPGTALDNTPPSVPGAATTSDPSGKTLNVQWAASADVDGGGYMVVRYTADPAAQPLPNENGVYNLGNTIGSGTVAYTGSANSFIDFGLANNTTYYYRVFTVDKAFNYSSPVSTSGATNTAPPSINYYIDAISGSDANAGTITSPWKNISKLNNQTFSEGVHIFLKCGSVWTGQQLKFKGSGSAAAPIKIDKYGTGATPLLAGNGLVGQAVLYLYNQQYIEVRNLEITNSPNGPVNSDFFVGLYQNGNNPLAADRRGVMVALDDYGTANHIYFKNLYVHHIKGMLGNGQTTVNGAIPKRTGGMYFTVLGNIEQASSKSRFNDIHVDSCEISYCENTGLSLDNEWDIFYPGGNEYNDWYDRRFSQVKISNSVLHHIGKNAMIIRCTDSTGLIERNICYETALGTTGNTMFTARARGTVFQYNEGYYNRAATQNVDPGSIDGCMYDPDYGSINIIFQYSYSHDNSHGIYWGCNSRSSLNTTSGIPDPEDKGCTLRYCISQNDQGNLVFFNYPSSGNEIYNNVFYIKQGTSPNIISENSSNQHTYNYFNNIVYNLSSSSSVYNFATSGQTRNIQYNVFYGNHPSSEPADAFKIISNPMFASPGTATFGVDSLQGYKLMVGSPALASGRIINNNGGFDLFGAALPATAPNRGVYEGPGLSILSLPFSDVSAKKIGRTTLIEWTAQKEDASQYYVIERSSDGIRFSAIGTVRQSFVSINPSSLSFVDANPIGGVNYYRIKLVSSNGRFSFSKIKRLNFNTEISISVYPNPVNDVINVKTDFNNIKLAYSISSINGSIVESRVNVSASNFAIRADKFGSGLYILKVFNIETGEELGQTSFIK